MPHLLVRDLAPGRFDQAFPLARAANPQLTLAAWRHFLRALKAEGGGVLAVQNRRGVLLGIAVYRLRPSLTEGPCLDSDPVVVFDLVGGAAIAQRLVAALESRATDLGCSSLTTHLLTAPGAPGETPLHRAFALQGHRVEATRLCKRLAPQRPN